VTEADGRPTGTLTQVARFRLVQWTKIFSAYFSAQSVAQLLGIGAGLLFINFMPVEEFALYTLAFSVVSFFHFLTDLGSSSSLVYFQREALKEGGNLGDYVAAVLSLRKVLFAVGAVAVVGAFPVIAGRQGFGLERSLLVAAAITATVWFQLVSSIRVLVLRLEGRYGHSYRAEMLGGGLRLVLAAILVATSLLHAWLGVLTATVAAAGVSWAARPSTTARPDAETLRAHRRKVLRYLLPTLPSALYFSIQGPLVVWLAAAFASTENIAQVGALGRLGMVVGLFTSLVPVVFLPRLSQVTDDRLYRRRYLQFGAFLVMIAAALVAGAWFAPEPFLFVLGPHYSGLNRELLLTVGGAGLNLVSGFAVAVNLARSWNRWQGAAVGTLVVVQATLVALLPLGTTAGVLTFNLLTAAAGLSLQLITNLVGFARPHWVHWS